MTAHWLEEAVNACGLTAPSRYPRDLASELLWLPFIEMVAMPELSPDAMRAWLSRRGVRHPVAADTHELTGCMVAERGHGFLFFDSSRERTEQRFTIAHEFAHFVLEQVLPRRKAVEVFGDAILQVLDGEREPTPEESLTALFERIALGRQPNLMARDDSGLPASRAVMEAEHRADLLALELLAPEALALPLVKNSPSDQEARGRLVFRFGIPWDMAEPYVHWLRERLRVPRFSIDAFLGVEGE
ncbi:ImmA/IrrE family metallo-endopeptidase [Myxococcus stipitatus]|uniref:ImmA/IrrE family metallo-endopeptidase n=1 Tax=Myxococcus stipitatus TaxID=83455 RepID=UPI001F37F728|nr:ImmA/IrrE family metallo-endopeptidase [Myxococcus stipitatus]MCE9672622.1 ImmA/IrrE family metallo-endopeptidase [Myxococcus stipitatus]